MKLLSRTIITYSILTIIIFFIATPIFYFLISKLIIEDVDEDLSVKKIFIQKKANLIKDESQIAYWQRMQDNMDLEPIAKRDTFADLISYITLYDSIAKDQEPYRELKSVINIKNNLYKLKVRVSLVESEDLINTIVKMQLFIFLGLILGLILTNRLISKRMWSNFYQTLNRLRNYNLTETSILQLNDANISEFKELNEVIIKMTNKMHTDYNSMKQFTENASHEIQTPLSIIKNRVELILQDETLKGENLNYIKSIYEASNRLSRVNQSLILLSKLENRQFNNYEKIDIKSIIEEKIEMLNERILEKNIELNLFLENEIISINKNLAQILISNLITNAIKHNIINGLLKINLEDNYLIISNTGEVPKKPMSKYFERFQKDNQSSESLGLGLAIVKEICDHEGIEIIYEYKNNLHIIKLIFIKN